MNLNEPKIEPRLLDDLKARGLLKPATELLQNTSRRHPAARPGETIDDDGVITIKSAPGGEVGNRLQTDFARMFGSR